MTWGRVGAVIALACVAVATRAEKIPGSNEGFDIQTTKDEWKSTGEDRAGWTQVIKYEGKGNTPATIGSTVSGSIVFGVVADKCPALDGIVKGTGTWDVTLNRHLVQPDGVNDSLLSLSVVVEFTGHVNDNARLASVDAETTYQRQQRGGIRTREGPLLGVPAAPTHQTMRATYQVKDGKFGAVGFSDIDPMKAHVDEAASITAILGYQAEQVFKEAELAWLKENACVEMKFDPATSTTRVAPGESVRVKAELQTRNTPATVGAGFQDAKPVAGGSVTPRQGRSAPGAPIEFTYTAPQEKTANKGFGVLALSRAGVGFGVWAPLGFGAVKFEGITFNCDIPTPDGKLLHMETRITGESCADLGNWTIRPTRITRGPGINEVKTDKPFETSCVPIGSPEAESQLRARRARPAGAGGFTCTYAVAADGTVTLTFFNFKSSFCQGAKEETLPVVAQPTDRCGEQPPPPPQNPPPRTEPPPPRIPVLPPL
jgi:hypothetical protein